MQPNSPFYLFVQPPGANSSVGNQNQTNNTYFLCGVPPFCDNSAFTDCSNVSLGSCQRCSMVGAAFFGVIVFLLGLAILISNGFVIFCTAMKRTGFTGQHNAIKASLAVADFLSGIQIMTMVMFNFVWSLVSTPEQLNNRAIQLCGSAEANFGGIFYVFCFTSSLHHLILMGQQRLYAIRWPLGYRLQTWRTIFILLAFVWVSALISSTAPAWFPNVYMFVYSSPIFLYSASLALYSDSSYKQLLHLFLSIYASPFIIMTIISISTALIVRFKLAKKWQEVKDNNKREIRIFVSLALMQTGFTITLLPIVIVLLLSYNGVVDCNNFSVPYATCFYFSTSNSLVNVLVYSFRDDTFRQAVKHYFHIACRVKKDRISFQMRQQNSSHH